MAVLEPAVTISLVLRPSAISHVAEGRSTRTSPAYHPPARTGGEPWIRGSNSSVPVRVLLHGGELTQGPHDRVEVAQGLRAETLIPGRRLDAFVEGR